MKPQIITSPLISEKTLKLATLGAYTFKVRANANKKEIAQAVKNIYKVGVKSVKIATIPPLKIQKARRFGQTSGYKKAIVVLLPGQKIEGFGLEEKGKTKKKVSDKNEQS